MSTRVIGRFIALASVGAITLTGMPATSAAADTTPPVLTSVSFSRASAGPGDTVTVTLVASDDVAIAKSAVSIIEESSLRAVSGGDSSTPLDVDFTVASTWANGVHRVRTVTLDDTAGNRATYYLTGDYNSTPATSTTHTVDLAGPTFSVAGAADRTPPLLTSVAVTSEATRVGVPSVYSFAVAPAEPVTIRAVWRSGVTGAVVGSDVVSMPTGSGAVEVSLPYAGSWGVSRVEVTDALGNAVYYLPNGTMQPVGGTGLLGGVAALPHDVNLSGLYMDLAPGEQDVRVVPRPGRLTLVRYGVPEDAQAHRGYQITVQPAGVVREIMPEDIASGTYDITGLPNGVTQTVTFTALSFWGDSPTKTLSGRPVLSGNVTGIADVTGDRKPDVVAQGQFLGNPELPLLSYAGTGTGGLRAATVYLSAGQGGCEQVGPMDVYVIGTGEPLCQKDDLVAMNRGGGGQTVGTRGWRAMSWVDGGFSLNADVYPDVIAMNPRGELLMYPMRWDGRPLAATRIGTGWGSMISVISAGDLTGDRRNDIAAVDASGRLWLYAGNGAGGVTARRQIGSGWQNMAALLPLRDLSGDGRADLGGITPAGELRLYRGTGTGGVQPGIVIGTGWQRFL